MATLMGMGMGLEGMEMVYGRAVVMWIWKVEPGRRE